MKFLYLDHCTANPLPMAPSLIFVSKSDNCHNILKSRFSSPTLHHAYSKAGLIHVYHHSTWPQSMLHLSAKEVVSLSLN